MEIFKNLQRILKHISIEKLNEIFNTVKETKIYIPVLIAGIMGLRRSEVLGLKWDCIDFEKKTLTVKFSLVKLYKNKKIILHFSDKLKTASSYRTLPMPDKLIDVLKEEKCKQIFAQLKNKNYNKEYIGFINVDYNGDILKPDSITNAFSRRSKKYSWDIRFHDLRHSCASILFNFGFTLKEISEWLGHSNISTTSNIYIHTYFQKKRDISDKINSNLLI